MPFLDFLADIPPAIEYTCDVCGDVLRVPLGAWHGKMLQAASWGWESFANGVRWCKSCATSTRGVAASLTAFCAWAKSRIG